MKQSILAILCFTLYSITLLSQRLPLVPYEPLNLSGEKPILWYEAIHDDSRVNSFCDGKNWLGNRYYYYPIVTGDFIYTFLLEHEYRGGGFYLEKRNIHTGQLQWQRTMDIGLIGRPEVIKKMFINNDGHLETLGYRANSDEFYTKSKRDCKFVRRIYDNNNGNLLYHSTTDSTVINPINMSNSGNRTIIYPNIFQTSVNGEYIYVENNITDYFAPRIYEELIAARINDKGEILAPIDTVKVGEEQRQQNMFQLSPDTIIYIDIDLARTRVKIKYLDNHLHTIKEIETEKMPIPIEENMILFKYDKDHFMLTGFRLDFRGYANMSYVAFDYNGKVLDYIDMPDNYWEYSSNAVYLPEYKRMIAQGVVSWRNDDEQTAIQIFVSDGKGGISGKYNWYHNGDSLRTPLAYAIDGGAGKIVMTLKEGRVDPNDPRGNFDQASGVFTNIGFNASDLGLTPVATDDQKSRQIDFIVHPNPAYDKINITIPEYNIISGFSIFTSTGLLVGNVICDQTETHIGVDISSLVQGIYTVIAHDKNGKLVGRPKKIVKI